MDYDGDLITSVLESYQSAGTYSISWDGSNASGEIGSTGVYFCRLEAGEYSQTIKMVYLHKMN